MRLINADALLSALEIAEKITISPLIKTGLEQAAQIVDTIPTIEITPEGYVDAEAVAGLVVKAISEEES